jgi:hypothetical protein
MKLRRTALSVLFLGALLAPTAAVADDVHITIATKHVMRSGTQKLKVSGQLHLLSGSPSSCAYNRTVVVQRKTSTGWKGLGQDTTNSNGGYSKAVADRTGKYRVVAPSAASCERDVSAAKQHSH